MELTKKQQELMQNYIVNEETGCHEWQGGKFTNGYGCICINNKRLKTHRVSYMAYHNVKLDSSQVIMHKCDNPACINPAHLSEGTVAENNYDKVKKGRQVSKITKETALAIRNAKGKQKEIADAYGISQPQVSAIKNKKSWKHI